jgi:hypothetical protein
LCVPFIMPGEPENNRWIRERREARIQQRRFGRAHDLNGTPGENEAKWRDWDWIAFAMLAGAVLVTAGLIALIILGDMGIIGGNR